MQPTSWAVSISSGHVSARLHKVIWSNMRFVPWGRSMGWRSVGSSRQLGGTKPHKTEILTQLFYTMKRRGKTCMVKAHAPSIFAFVDPRGPRLCTLRLFFFFRSRAVFFDHRGQHVGEGGGLACKANRKRKVECFKKKSDVGCFSEPCSVYICCALPCLALLFFFFYHATSASRDFARRHAPAVHSLFRGEGGLKMTQSLLTLGQKQHICSIFFFFFWPSDRFCIWGPSVCLMVSFFFLQE